MIHVSEILPGVLAAAGLPSRPAMLYPQLLDLAWKEAIAPREPGAPTVISTFAGTGGSSLGYSMAGYIKRLSVEWDAHAVECYKRNFPGVPVFHGDIGILSVDQGLELAQMQPGELDVFDGSPPCQGFSTTGKREFGDGRNLLFEHYARLLAGLRPKAFVMENVSGMVKGAMKLMFGEIFEQLTQAGDGYRVKAKLLNAKHYGVPQSRERMIFIGMRKDLKIDPVHPAAEYLVPISVQEALEGCPPPPPDLPEMTAHYTRMWHLLKPGTNGSAIVANKNWNFLKLHPAKPAPTICKSVMLTGFGAMTHWAEPRCLTIPELKRLGSFPDAFDLVGEFENQWARIGNAVPPLLMRAIARQVRLTLTAAGALKPAA